MQYEKNDKKDNEQLDKQLKVDINFNTVSVAVKIEKQGFIKSLFEEIRIQLKKKKLIKRKLLRYFIDSIEGNNNRAKVVQVAEKLTKKLDAELLLTRGFTILREIVNFSS